MKKKIINEKFADVVIGEKPWDFDTIELQGCREDKDGIEVDNENPEFYSVYLRDKVEGLAHCVGNFTKHSSAEAYFWKLAAKHGYKMGAFVDSPSRIAAKKKLEKDIEKAQKERQYYALHECGLRNGSFYRVSKYGVGEFINGDFMGRVPELPKTYCGKPLVMFPTWKAETMIPECCRPGH